MNPEFSEKVDAILKRSNSTLGRLSVSSKDNKAANLIEDIDETGSQSSEEQDLQLEMDTEDKKTL